VFTKKRGIRNDVKTEGKHTQISKLKKKGLFGKTISVIPSPSWSLSQLTETTKKHLKH
jgi:hypothetical protein